jgi:hypothetical protein
LFDVTEKGREALKIFGEILNPANDTPAEEEDMFSGTVQ